MDDLRNFGSRSLIVILLYVYGELYAQQPPDCGLCNCAVPSMLGTTLTTATTHGPCNNTQQPTFDPARFGRFHAIAGNHYDITLCGATADTYALITTNTTLPGILRCDDDGCGTADGPASMQFTPSATGTYRVYVFNGNCGVVFPIGSSVTVQITCITTTAPPNDLPCGAIALPLNANNCNYHYDDNTFASNAALSVPGIGPVPPCTSTLYQGADLWYTITVPASGLIGINTDEITICAGAFQLYTATGCNGNFTQLPGGCVTTGLTGPTSVPATLFDAFGAGLTVGQTIYIRYWERNGNENGTFGICAWEAQPPVNDDPCEPLALPLNSSCQPQEFYYENASPSTVTAPGCGTGAFNDVWFTFTVPDPLPTNWNGITVITDPIDPVALGMAWYRLTATCTPGDLVPIACNASGEINSATISPSLLNAGETIYVRVWGTQPWFGPYEICAVLNTPPLNNEPCSALPLQLEYGCSMQAFTNTWATTTGTNPPGTLPGGVPNPSCGAPAQNDVWFTVTVPPNGIVQLDMLSGIMTDAAMAVYRVLSGSCATNNMSLQQIAGACAVNGSQQGAASGNMPYINVNGQVPGSTLYVRVWRQTGSDGTFGICARRIDPPPGDCHYTLNMFDSAGDGWGGSHVTICVAGNCINYTMNGANAWANIGVYNGQPLTISYTAAGGNQNQIAYSLTQYGTPVFVAPSPPTQGLVYTASVWCMLPPAPNSDCIGANTICSNGPMPCFVYNGGGVSGELDPGNAGCLVEENNGIWMTFPIDPSIPPCSPLAFDISGTSCAGAVPNTVFDFAIWGPYPSSAFVSDMCPVDQQPIRCNYATIGAPAVKGLAYDNTLPTSQAAGGGAMVKHLIVDPGQQYLMFVNNRSGNGHRFRIVWKTPGPAFVADAADCIVGTSPPSAGSFGSVSCYALPLELIDLTARPRGSEVEVDWTTASETGTSHFIVERSQDGSHFEPIGNVSAAGHSIVEVRYSFIDRSPYTGLSYYRLQQVDLDGVTTESHSLPVHFRGRSDVLDVFPNPADQTIWISFDMEKEAPMRWRISDASGRLVRENNILTTSGKNQFELPIEKLEQGSYMMEVVHEDGSTLGVRRFVKQ
jgi:hypothetical protein